MTHKSIEIYYDMAGIPGSSLSALDFRNDAMHLIEAAMEAAGVGEWEGAEIGSGEVNFGFTVEDFDAAETVVREAVAGTEYEGIREIQRREFSPEDYEAFESADVGNIPLRFRILQIVLPLLLIPFLIFAVLRSVFLGRIFRR